MEKRNKLKKVMAMVAIFLFIGPLFLVAIMNYSNYHADQKTLQETTSQTTSDTSDDEDISSETEE